MKKLIIVVVVLVIFCLGVWSNNAKIDQSKEKEIIKKVIVDAYIKGIITKGDADLVKKGWHEDCDIVIFHKGKMRKLPASYWIKRLTAKPGPIETDVQYEFKNIMITGYAAIAVVKVSYKNKPKYMDYMSLYKFPEGWKIATKIYYEY